MQTGHAQRLALVAAVFLAAVAVRADAPDAPLVVAPESLLWTRVPQLAPEIRAATLVGNPAVAGPYAMRVRLPAGSRIPPHTHPDARLVTVLSGEYGLGTDAAMQSEKLRRLGAGSVVLLPAGVVHYSVALNGDVEFQESGVGPSGVAFVDTAAH